jgi:hypothetical protein
MANGPTERQAERAIQPPRRDPAADSLTADRWAQPFVAGWRQSGAQAHFGILWDESHYYAHSNSGHNFS